MLKEQQVMGHKWQQIGFQELLTVKCWFVTFVTFFFVHTTKLCVHLMKRPGEKKNLKQREQEQNHKIEDHDIIL